jgi:hypothetical protein
MSQREFIILIYRALSFYADDPQTGKGQRRGLLLAMSALERYYQLKTPPKAKDLEPFLRVAERKVRRIVPTEQEAKQDKEIVDRLVPMC